MIQQQLYDYSVTCVIMGGGAGTRLFPLTQDRAKPAVPVGAKYRLIDIPISNCLNSGLNRIYLLTQYRTHYNGGCVVIRDGITVVPRGGVVPDGFRAYPHFSPVPVPTTTPYTYRGRRFAPASPSPARPQRGRRRTSRFDLQSASPIGLDAIV